MIWFFNDPFWSPVASLIIAVTGGIARQYYEQLRHPKKKIVPGRFRKEVFIATFCGIMALFLALLTGITGYGVHIFCGIGAWTSPNFLTLISRKVEKETGCKEGELSIDKKKD